MRTRRKTKIICTIGPATHSLDAIEALARAGMNVARINMSHAKHDQAAAIVDWVREANERLAHPVAVLLDTAGPEIRTGERVRPLLLRQGDVVTVGANLANHGPSIGVDYDEIDSVLAVGDVLRLDNGLINLRVMQNDAGRLVCEVQSDGELGSRKHVNLPGVHVNLPALTEKDRRDVAFGIELGVDWIAQSFVRAAEDVAMLREALGPSARIGIIAKVESQEGLANAVSIARVADGLMVARGDLGIETAIAELPVFQRRLMAITGTEGRRSIVATQMLESMIDHPIPTRAEVTDVANAIYEGADAIMLSGETSIGAHPVAAAAQMATIAEVAEREVGFGLEQALVRSAIKQHVAIAAVRLAESIEAAGILVVTRHGVVANYVANARPRVSVFAFTNNATTQRRLALVRGVFAVRTRFSRDPERTIRAALATLERAGDLTTSDRVVVISDVLAETPVDSIQIRHLAE